MEVGTCLLLLSGNWRWLIRGVGSVSAARGDVDMNDQLNDNKTYLRGLQWDVGLYQWVYSQGRNMSVPFADDHNPRDWNQWFGPHAAGFPNNNHTVSETRTQREDVSPIPLDSGGWAVAWFNTEKTKWSVKWFVALCTTSVELCETNQNHGHRSLSIVGRPRFHSTLIWHAVTR